MKLRCTNCSQVAANDDSFPASACAECGGALEPVPASAPKPTSLQTIPLVVGILVVCISAGLFWVAMKDREEYVSATATVQERVLKKTRETQLRTSGEWYWDNYESEYTASFKVNGVTHQVSPGPRQMKNQQFTVWYKEANPREATEKRPFGLLVCSLLGGVVGLALIAWAFGIFGGITKDLAEAMQEENEETPASKPVRRAEPKFKKRWYAEKREG